MWWQEWLEAEGIEWLVHHQGGVVSRQQLLAGGWTDLRVRSGHRTRRWQTIFPGVYATFTGEPTYDHKVLAGLLYAGEGAMWSHRTAAEQSLLVKIKRGQPVHVTVPRTRQVRPQDGLVVHRCSGAAARLGQVVPPRSAPAHAVLDMVEVADRFDDAAALVAEACQSGRVTVEQIVAALQQRRLRWYRRELVPILEAVAKGSHSLLEIRYLRDVERRHNLPPGIRQRPVDDEFTDVAYEGLVVELDGRFHLDPVRRRRDMDRDNRATLRAEATLRYGWLDVTSRPCEVAAQVLAVQRRGGRPDQAAPCGPSCPVTGWPPRTGDYSSLADE